MFSVGIVSVAGLAVEDSLLADVDVVSGEDGG